MHVCAHYSSACHYIPRHGLRAGRYVISIIFENRTPTHAYINIIVCDLKEIALPRLESRLSVFNAARGNAHNSHDVLLKSLEMT